MIFGSVLFTVCLGVAFVGAGAGLMGSIVSLRGRNLEADVMAHCTLPGLVFGVLVAHLLPTASHLSGGLSILAGMATALAAIVLITFTTRRVSALFGIGPDAIQAVTLGLGFGSSMVLLSLVQSYVPAQRAGLDKLLLGNAAVLTANDLWLAVGLLAGLMAGFIALRRHIQGYLFDGINWQLGGGRPWVAEAAYALALFLVMLMGIRVVGIVLMVAFLALPWMTARMIAANNLNSQVFLSAIFAAICGVMGTLISFWVLDANGQGLSTGPTIVLTMACLFVATAIVLRWFGPGFGRRGDKS